MSITEPTTTAEPATVTARREPGWKPLHIAKKAAPTVVAAVVALWLIPAFSGSYWLFILTSGVIAIPVMQSLGVITGRVGVMSLCQLSFAMIGAWAVGWANVLDVPGGFLIWMLIAGVAAVPAGLIIGLPALRLRGVNLAIVTFAFALALDTIFSAQQYPGAASFEFVTRPDGFTNDEAYFRLSVLVVAALFALLWFIDRTRLGASWLELRYSERGAAAHGTNVAVSKLSAFAISAFIAGIGGALIAGQSGTTTPAPFTAQASLTYFAIAVVIGVRFWEAAVVAGLIGSLMPVLLEELGVQQNYVSIAFGIVAVLILAGGKGQLGQSEIIRAKKDAKAARRREDENPIVAVDKPDLPEPLESESATEAAARGEHPALELHNLTVEFGSTCAVDNANVAMPPGSVVGLLGPNGAGKSTLINALTGLTDYSGNVLLNGKTIDSLAPHQRARAGLRRSFQQLRVPPTLSAGMFLRVAAGRRLGRHETDQYLAWFGCPPADVPIGTMDVGTRRMLEVAGLTAGNPPVVLLDEPAAGQGARETSMLAARIQQIPRRFGSTVLLVEHDVDLVRSTCDTLVVMNFGKIIAAGPPDEVLADPEVMQVYVGTTPDERHE